MRRTFQGYLRAVRNPVFRRFWLGMMVSRCGSAFTVVALSWLVLDLARPRELGLAWDVREASLARAKQMPQQTNDAVDITAAEPVMAE